MIKVTIGQIDPYGYCGRDFHPEATDNGKVGVLIGTQVEQYVTDDFDPSCDVFSDGVTNVDIDRWRKLQEDANQDTPTTILIVKLEDGRRVDLVEHEVAKIEVDLS